MRFYINWLKTIFMYFQLRSLHFNGNDDDNNIFMQLPPLTKYIIIVFIRFSISIRICMCSFLCDYCYCCYILLTNIEYMWIISICWWVQMVSEKPNNYYFHFDSSFVFVYIILFMKTHIGKINKFIIDSPCHSKWFVYNLFLSSVVALFVHFV